MNLSLEFKKKQQEQWTTQFTLTQEQKTKLFANKLDRMKLYSPTYNSKIGKKHIA